MTESRPAHKDEIRDFFFGVDEDIIYDLWMADLCFVSSDGSVIVNDVTRMFGFMLRRLYPAPEG